MFTQRGIHGLKSKATESEQLKVANFFCLIAKSLFLKYVVKYGLLT